MDPFWAKPKSQSRPKIYVSYVDALSKKLSKKSYTNIRMSKILIEFGIRSNYAESEIFNFCVKMNLTLLRNRSCLHLRRWHTSCRHGDGVVKVQCADGYARLMLKGHSLCLPVWLYVCHTADPRLNGSSIERCIAPNDRSMFLQYLGAKFHRR